VAVRSINLPRSALRRPGYTGPSPRRQPSEDQATCAAWRCLSPPTAPCLFRRATV